MGYRFPFARILFVSLVLAAGTLHASAQGGACGDAPMVGDERLKGELDSRASILSRFLGDMKFKGQVEIEKNDVLNRYPNADKLRLNQYFLYTVCLIIMNDPRMSAERKLEKLIEARESIFQPSSGRSDWLRPDSFKLTVNGLRIDKSAQYEGVLNFTIDNLSKVDLGIGVLANGATAAGCSGSSTSTGLPEVAPAGEINIPTGIIPMGALKRARDPARHLRWLPAGGRLSATIRWDSCDAGMRPTSRSVSVSVPVVLAAGKDVL